MSEPQPYELDRGVTLDALQVWRDADTGNVIFQVPLGREQIVMTPEQWDRAVEFLAQPVEAESSPTSAE